MYLFDNGSPSLCFPQVLKKVSTTSAVEQFEKAMFVVQRDAETEEVVFFH